jgi:hypothetical protein
MNAECSYCLRLRPLDSLRHGHRDQLVCEEREPCEEVAETLRADRQAENNSRRASQSGIADRDRVKVGTSYHGK